ncbi:MAG: GNAT family N-acetyltransferase [Weeksellaceae bacterium]
MKVIWHFKNFDDLTPRDLYSILQLRNEVFVVEQKCIYNDVDGKDLDCPQLWATLNGEIVASCRIVPPGISYKEPSIGRIASHPKHRHLKLGHQIMRHSLQIIQNLYGTTSVRISAQCYLKGFYEKYGFVQSSEEYLEDLLPHMEMVKED